MERLTRYIIVLLVLIIYSCVGSKKGINNKKKSDEYVIDKYAEMMNVPKATIGNLKLYSFIDSWYGVKYKYGGLSKKGIDCSGFCNILYNEIYNKQIERSTQGLAQNIKIIKKDKLEEGHLVFFNTLGKTNTHVGVYLTNGKFVHASTSKGVIISSLDNPYYIKNYSKGGKVL